MAILIGLGVIGQVTVTSSLKTISHYEYSVHGFGVTRYKVKVIDLNVKRWFPFSNLLLICILKTFRALVSIYS